ncbi:hypothetical protein [Actinocrispum sp. NPDC049592]|uniref:hypothetical protein n=1 Tax=Actinocrispum sp. NPDC049592 TaxID=3154835 RepID=UPI00341C49AA
MNNDLDLPPFTPIPADVRDRVRRRVQERIRRPRSYRRPIAVAAAVALLATGAVYLLSGGSSTSEPAKRNQSDVVMNRCWSAIQRVGKEGDFPDRSTWLAPIVEDEGEYSGVAVAGISAGGSKFFCETTATTVTVTRPSAELRYAPGTRTALLLTSAHGTVAGLADPTWPAVVVTIPGHSTAVRPVHDGMFVYTGDYRLQDTTIQAKRAETAADVDGMDDTGAELPAPQPPAVIVVDRVPLDKEKFSHERAALEACQKSAAATSPVPEAGSYTGGPDIDRDFVFVIPALSETRLAACTTSHLERTPPGPSRFIEGPALSDVDSEHKPVAFYPGPLPSSGGDHTPLVGVVPKNVARMEIWFGDHWTVQPDVVNRMFALLVPADVPLGQDGRVRDENQIKVRLFGPVGQVSYEGPLTVWHPN